MIAADNGAVGQLAENEGFRELLSPNAYFGDNDPLHVLSLLPPSVNSIESLISREQIDGAWRSLMAAGMILERTFGESTVTEAIRETTCDDVARAAATTLELNPGIVDFAETHDRYTAAATLGAKTALRSPYNLLAVPNITTPNMDTVSQLYRVANSGQPAHQRDGMSVHHDSDAIEYGHDPYKLLWMADGEFRIRPHEVNKQHVVTSEGDFATNQLLLDVLRSGDGAPSVDTLTPVEMLALSLRQPERRVTVRHNTLPPVREKVIRRSLDAEEMIPTTNLSGGRLELGLVPARRILAITIGASGRSA